MLSADRQTEMISAAASRAQPTSEKLRACQQHIARLAAEAQVDEVARTTAEQAERGMRSQQAAQTQAGKEGRPAGSTAH